MFQRLTAVFWEYVYPKVVTLQACFRFVCTKAHANFEMSEKLRQNAPLLDSLGASLKLDISLYHGLFSSGCAG